MARTVSTTLHDQSRATSGVITVASAPAGHPYVTRISAAPRVVLLPDPPVPGAPEGVWWPPAVLDAAWIARNRSAAQLLHIHFGTESFSPAQLAAAIDAAHHAGWPVVFTAHDLEHPQLTEQTVYAEQLDVLVRGADAVITLTEGAASVIRETWNRAALVIRHPSVLMSDATPRPARMVEGVRIGVHLKDLRPNVDGPGTVRALLAAAARMRVDGVPVTAEVRLHSRVRDEPARDEIRRLCVADPGADLIEHERLSDAELAIALSRLDVCVLPYRHGTHSGWLELCWDLGVPVAAPKVGFYAEQHDDGSVQAYLPGDASSLTTALESLVATPEPAPEVTRAGSIERTDIIRARRAMRRLTDLAITGAHASLYRSLLDGRSS